MTDRSRNFLGAGLVALLLFFLPSMAGAQLQDAHWIFGYGSNATDTLRSINHLDFSTDPPTITPILRQIAAQPSAQTLSDTDGNLLMFSNGCRIYNADFEPIPEPNPAIPGEIGLDFCDGYFGYPSASGYIPLPINDSSVFFIYKSTELKPGIGYITEEYNYHQFNCSGNKCHYTGSDQLVSDPIDHYDDYLSIVRHGNGRDWWVISPGVANNAYHRALVTPDGVEDKGWTNMGIPFGQDTWGGSLTFSRNGDMMARSDGFNGVHLYGFDRCSGEFTWYKRLVVFPLDQVFSAFCAFSNDDRFLYVSYAGWPAGEFRSLMYQLDLHKTDPWTNRIRVGEIKLNYCTFGTPIYGHLLNGPDRKIYVFAYDNCDLLHIIHHPDSLGLACQVENDAIRTPALYRLNTPIFPNYRLGRAVGQYCDTLYRDPFAYTLTVSPNPATDIVHVELQTPLQTGPEVRFSFYDLLGRPVSQTVQKIDRFSEVQAWTINTSSLSAGIYILHAEVPGKWQKAIKVILQSP